jgi:hypothetical protein
VLPQQLQDVLMLALAALSDPERRGEGLDQLLELLELPTAAQLDTQALQSLVNAAFKVSDVFLQARDHFEQFCSQQ